MKFPTTIGSVIRGNVTETGYESTDSTLVLIDDGPPLLGGARLHWLDVEGGNSFFEDDVELTEVLYQAPEKGE